MQFYTLLLFVFVLGKTKGNEEKRLLLNDPDLMTRFLKMERKIETLEAELAAEKARNTNSAGSTFVRWGRTTCPTSTEKVYKGYGGGQRYYHKTSSSYFGGPANFLCLPDDPELPNSTYSHDNLIEGVEYEWNAFGLNSQDEDMPCAVCRSSTAETILMIPGRATCYSGWNMEYSGMLASGHNTHSPSTYICVDQHPEFIVNGHKNEDGRALYTVGYHCGPLPCPPYQDNRQVLCVVCSK